MKDYNGDQSYNVIDHIKIEIFIFATYFDMNTRATNCWLLSGCEHCDA